jgi:hypothetical protein
VARKSIGSTQSTGGRTETIPCAHANCGIDAMCRIKTKTGWADVCWQHYDAHYAAQARANCAAKGLHTTAQLREAWKVGTATLARRMRNREVMVQREPGEDWDEVPADQHQASRAA